jgi:hypothetical protein
LFVTSQGSAYARFRRALDSQNATVAYATATELDFVGLSDALELVLLVVEDPRRFRRAALRWHARYCAEVQEVGVEEAQAVLACLAGLAGRQPKAAASAHALRLDAPYEATPLHPERHGGEADWWFVDGVREPSDFVEHGASWLV